MGFFSRLFGGDKQDHRHTTQHNSHARVDTSAPARGISFDASLIERLKNDHEDLVALYQKIGGLLESGKYGDIRSELVNFKTRFEAHILTENVRFYVYLEQQLQDTHNIELMRDFRREMNTIARGVVEFVKKYQFTAFDAGLREQFAQDYRTVGGLLAQRIEREESNLYPLYQHG